MAPSGSRSGLLRSLDPRSEAQRNRRRVAGPIREDHALLSHPKSGRTWLRLMIGEALELHFGLGADDEQKLRVTPLARLGPAVPSLRVTHDTAFVTSPATTERQWRRRYGGCRVVLMVRDPRDTLVSYFFQLSKREATPTGGMAEWIRSGPAEALVAYYAAWVTHRQLARELMLLRYEDLLADTAGELVRVLRFLGLDDVSDETVGTAVELAQFDRMRAREAAGSFSSNKLQARDVNDPESFKARRAKVGGSLDYLSADDIAWLEEVFSRLDPWYGYSVP
jgi:hypothetical protein